VDRLSGLVVGVPDYTTEMYCASYEVRTEYIYYVKESRPPVWSSAQSSWLHNGMYCASCEVRTKYIYVM
jgi:hypothetical protein